MNNTIKLLLLPILLSIAPAMQAMGSLRNFGAFTFKTTYDTATKFKLNKYFMNRINPLMKPFNTNNGDYQKNYNAHITAIMPIMQIGVLYGTYEKIKECFGFGYREHKLQSNNNQAPPKQHDYDAPIPLDIKRTLDEHAGELEKLYAQTVKEIMKCICLTEEELSALKTERPELYKKLNKEQIQRKLIESERKRIIRTFDWLPGWIVKDDPNHRRIEGAKKFASAIEELGCSFLVVPKKYRYTAPSGEHYTIAQIVNPSKEQLTSEEYITLKEFKQILQMTKKLGWWDIRSENITKTSDGKIAFIDTEPYFKENLSLNYYLNRCKYLPLTREAKEYLRAQILTTYNESSQTIN